MAVVLLIIFLFLPTLKTLRGPQKEIQPVSSRGKGGQGLPGNPPPRGSQPTRGVGRGAEACRAQGQEPTWSQAGTAGPHWEMPWESPGQVTVGIHAADAGRQL